MQELDQLGRQNLKQVGQTRPPDLVCIKGKFVGSHAPLMRNSPSVDAGTTSLPKVYSRVCIQLQDKSNVTRYDTATTSDAEHQN